MEAGDPNGLLQTVTTPDGLVLTYGYNASGYSPTNDQLASVTYSTTPSTSQSYLYGQGTQAFDLIGIIDENGKQLEAWTYDQNNRGLSRSARRHRGSDRPCL